MATLFLYPRFALVKFCTSGYTQILAELLQEERIASSVASTTAIYVYITDTILLRRLVNNVLTADEEAEPFTWIDTEPRNWLDFFTPLNKPWSIRYTTRFEVWNGADWQVRDIASEAVSLGYTIDISLLIRALGGEDYQPMCNCCGARVHHLISRLIAKLS